MATLEDAREVSHTLIAGLKPLSVMLFGSVAREGAGADLDLLIIVDDTGKDENQPPAVHRLLKNYSGRFGIDPFVVPRAQFSQHYTKGSPLLRAIVKEGRPLYMKDAAKEWMRQAADERDTAEYLFRGGFFKGACYHAQQAVEKLMKALLIDKGWDLEKTHSVERLASLAETYRIPGVVPEEDVVFLDTIYRGRYPFEAGLLPLGEPVEADARKAVQIAKSALEAAKGL